MKNPKGHLNQAEYRHIVCNYVYLIHIYYTMQANIDYKLVHYKELVLVKKMTKNSQPLFTCTGRPIGTTLFESLVE